MARHRRSERKAFGTTRTVTRASQSEAIVNTGTFGAFRAPELVGVSLEVKLANRDLARRARKAERNWLRSLPKGVKV